MKLATIICVAVISLVACQAKEKQKEPTVVYDPAVIRQFVFATASADTAHALAMTDSLLKVTAKDSANYRYVTSYLEKYFGDPNSNYRNESLYIHLLKEKMRSPWCDSLQKVQYRSILFLRMQNRPGYAANDFEYISPSGKQKKMYDLEADNILLLFYNPGCDACKEIRNALINSPVISNKVSLGKLKILAVYTDRDEKLWLDHLKEMPGNWIHGMDENEYLFKNSVYDLKAIPTIYLLDKSKNVVLKDCMNVSVIEKQLR